MGDFLRAGAVPIYIGFGSIVIQDFKNMTYILIKTCQIARVRIIISRGLE